MIKKFLVSLIVVLTAISAISFTAPQSAYADAAFTGGCRDFLGLRSWDCNVNISDQSTLSIGIWTIATNVLIDITIIAAYLVIGYTIYGGYLYIMSSGDPSKVAEGKKTLTHAFIGLAVVMLANIILNSISIALGADFSASCLEENSCANANPGAMVVSAIQWVIGVAGVVSAIFVVYGGVGYMTSAGDPGKLQKAKQAILYALIGLIIVALAETIVAFVSGIINNAKGTSSINETIISKEITNDKTD